MYNITTHSTGNIPNTTNIDISRTIIGLPTVFKVGTNDKTRAYEEWLTDQFANNVKVMAVLTEIHAMAKKAGSVNLFVANRPKAYEPKVLKNFIENHRDALEHMVSLFGLNGKSA